MSTAILFIQILSPKISWSRWSHSKKWNSFKISKNIKLNPSAWSTWKICKPVKILRQRRKTKKKNWRKSRKNRVKKLNKEITTSKTMTQVNKVVSHLLTIQINKWNHKLKISFHNKQKIFKKSRIKKINNQNQRNLHRRRRASLQSIWKY